MKARIQRITWPFLRTQGSFGHVFLKQLYLIPHDKYFELNRRILINEIVMKLNELVLKLNETVTINGISKLLFIFLILC